MMLPLSIYLICNKNRLPTIDSIGFVVAGFWTCLTDWTLIIFDEIPCENSWICLLMYLWEAVLDHCLTSMIEKTGTPDKYIRTRDRVRCYPLSTVSDFLLFFCCSKMMEDTQSAECNLANVCCKMPPLFMKVMFLKNSWLVCRSSNFGTFACSKEQMAKK